MGFVSNNSDLKHVFTTFVDWRARQNIGNSLFFGQIWVAALWLLCFRLINGSQPARSQPAGQPASKPASQLASQQPTSQPASREKHNQGESQTGCHSFQATMCRNSAVGVWGGHGYPCVGLYLPSSRLILFPPFGGEYKPRGGVREGWLGGWVWVSRSREGGG